MNKFLCCFNGTKKVIPENNNINDKKIKIINPKINQQLLNQFQDYNIIGDGYSCKVYKCIVGKKKYACKSIYKDKYTREA